MKILFSFIDNSRPSESANLTVDCSNLQDFSGIFNNIHSWDIGNVLFSFFGKLTSHMNAIFLHNSFVTLIKCDYKVSIRFYRPSSYYISVCDSNNNLLESMYDFSSLASFFDKTVKLNKYVDKVVKFTYDGGTSPGKSRIVKVISWHPGGNDPYITGHDLNGENWKENYRNYSLSKIRNEKIDIVE